MHAKSALGRVLKRSRSTCEQSQTVAGSFCRAGATSDGRAIERPALIRHGLGPEIFHLFGDGQQVASEICNKFRMLRTRDADAYMKLSDQDFKAAVEALVAAPAGKSYLYFVAMPGSPLPTLVGSCLTRLWRINFARPLPRQLKTKPPQASCQRSESV